MLAAKYRVRPEVEEKEEEGSPGIVRVKPAREVR